MRWKTDAEMRRASPSLPVVAFSARERSIVPCYPGRLLRRFVRVDDGGKQASAKEEAQGTRERERERGGLFASPGLLGEVKGPRAPRTVGRVSEKITPRHLAARKHQGDSHFSAFFQPRPRGRNTEIEIQTEVRLGGERYTYTHTPNPRPRASSCLP